MWGMRALRASAAVAALGSAAAAVVIVGGAAAAGVRFEAPAIVASDAVAASDGSYRFALDGGAVVPTAAEPDVVRNVPPTVHAVAEGAEEGGVGVIRATASDPGDGELSARIDWGDGTPEQAASIAQLAAGVRHGYGDDGDYPVVVTITDDDGGAGAHAVAMPIGNADPTLRLEVSDSVAFPGGRHAVIASGDVARVAAHAADPGSDDLILTWSNGLGRTFLHDGAAPDAPLSATGVAPVSAVGSTELRFDEPGIGRVRAAVADDDGGSADASATVLVTGTEVDPRSRSRWIQELTDARAGGVAGAAAGAYLEVVAAASGLFSESQPVATAAEAVAVLSPRVDDARIQARAELLTAWLQFASGAVSWDADVSTGPGAPREFGQLVSEAEAAIASPSTSDQVLRDIRADLSRVSNPGG